MGKVRKLRKKYKALCSKNVTISKSSISKNSKICVLPVKRNVDRVNVPSDELVFKTKYELLKNTCETNTKISDQQFCHGSSGIRANKNFIVRRKSSQEVLQSGDDLSLTKKLVGQRKNSRRMKNRTRKHATKIRHKNLIQDINTFKKTLKEESFMKNPETAVMNQTLERLSAECSFNSKEKVKNVDTSRKRLR